MTSNAVIADGVAAAGGAAAVVAAIRSAAARTGVDFAYLLGQARVESGLDPAARAATSSARGLYQFTSGTWLETVRRHGADHGLGWAADALASGAAGAGSAVRATILSLRDNAAAAAAMAAEFAHDNGAVLEARLGRAASATDLYMAHFLGRAGATKFLAALAAAPESPAADFAPAAAAANRAVFYTRGGAPRSLAEVYEGFARRLGAEAVAPAPASAAGNAAPGGGKPLPAIGVEIAAERARAAYLLLAGLGG